MNRKRNILLAIILGATGLLAGFLALLATHWRPRLITIQGAVIRKSSDPRKELAVSDALVTVSDGTTIASAQSDKSGYFKLVFREGIRLPPNAALIVRHAGYAPFVMNLPLTPRSNLRKLYVVKLRSLVSHSTSADRKHQTVVSNVLIRYTVNARTMTNIGTAVKTFEVMNKGNVPCRHQAPCSPDGFWKASRGSVVLKAGSGNVFRNVRVYCIAGPCSFTKIHYQHFNPHPKTIS